MDHLTKHRGPSCIEDGSERSCPWCLRSISIKTRHCVALVNQHFLSCYLNLRHSGAGLQIFIPRTIELSPLAFKVPKVFATALRCAFNFAISGKATHDQKETVAKGKDGRCEELLAKMEYLKEIVTQLPDLKEIYVYWEVIDRNNKTGCLTQQQELFLKRSTRTALKDHPKLN
ncbi:hypothetical protein M501DRAFT_1004312, partial [Patellaria atrata CBS 101060]